MAGNVKGVTIVFNGETTKLQAALRTIKNETREVDKELRQINTALKFNPGNTELVAQKMQVLKERISETRKQLAQLKDAQNQLDAKGVDKTSQEYRNLQREIIQTESKLKSFQSQLGQLKNGGLKALNQEAKDLKAQFAETEKEATKLKQEMVRLDAQGTDHASKEFQELENKLKETTNKAELLKKEIKLVNEARVDALAGRLDTLSKKMKTIGDKAVDFGRNMSMYVTTPLVGGASVAVKSYKEWESAFAGVKKTVDETPTTKYTDLAKGIKQIAQETASSREEVAAVAEIAGQLGVSADDLLPFVKTMVILGDTTNMSCEEAGMALAQFNNIMGNSNGDAMHLASSIVDLGNNYATTEKDIVKMSHRLASNAKVAGLTSQDVFALATAMGSVGIKAEYGGTSMGKVIAAINKQVVGGGVTLETWAKTAGMSAEEFATAWKTRPIEALQAFLDGLHKIKEQGGNPNGIIDEVLGGKMGTSARVTNTILALAESEGLLTDALETSNRAWDENTAATNEAEKRYATFETKISQTKEHLKAAGDVIAEILLPHILNLLNGIQKLSDWFVNLSPGAQEFIVKLGALAAVIGPLILTFGLFSKAISSILGDFSEVIKKGGLVSKIFGALTSPIGLAVLAIGGLTAAFIKASKEPDTFGKAINNFIKNAGKKLVDFINELPQKLKDFAAKLAKGLSDGLANAGKGVNSNTFLASFVKTVSETYKAVKDAIIKNGPAIIEAVVYIISLLIDSLSQHIPEMAAAAEEVFLTLVTAVSKALPEVVNALNGLILALLPVLQKAIPLLMKGAVALFEVLITALSDILPEIIKAIGEMIPALVTALAEAAPVLLAGAITLFTSILEGLITVLPGLLDAIAEAIPKIVDALVAAIPLLLEGAVQFFTAMVDAMPVILPKLLEALGTLLASLGQALIDHGPELLESALKAFLSILEAFLKLHGLMLGAIGAFIVDLNTKLIDKIMELAENIGIWIHNKWEELKKDAAEGWEKIKEAILVPFKATKKYLEEKTTELKTWIHEKWENIKTDTSNAWNKVKEFITTPIKNAYNYATEKLDGLRTWIHNKWDNIKTDTSNAWTRVKELITTPIKSAYNTVTDWIADLRDWILGRWDYIKDWTGKKWDQIADKILSPIKTLKRKIKDIIDDIKDLFDIDIPEPNIPVPHFDISPSWWTFEDLFDGVVPSLDIDWWAKGGIFKKPTLLGGGNGVGEAGPEAVLPLDQLWSQLAQMSDSIVNGILLGMQQQQQAAQNNGEVHFDIYLFPSGPKMGEQVVKAYDRYKPVYG